jgi:hypothetical protein
MTKTLIVIPMFVDSYPQAMSTILNQSETKLRSLQIFNIEVKQTMLLTGFEKMEVRRTLLIQELRKIKAK